MKALTRKKILLICLGIALLFLFIFVVFRCLSVGDPYEYQLEVGRGYYVLTPSGKLITWGDNENTAYSNSICWTPFFLRRTVLTDVVRVSSGSWATFAIDSSGNLWGQGSPVFGHLVSQYSEINDRWVLIMKDIAAVASGPQHAAAVTTDGELWTWGENNHNQLGIGYSSEEKLPPQKIMDQRPPKILCNRQASTV